jgi:hypothetical protein
MKDGQNRYNRHALNIAYRLDCLRIPSYLRSSLWSGARNMISELLIVCRQHSPKIG